MFKLEVAQTLYEDPDSKIGQLLVSVEMPFDGTKPSKKDIVLAMEQFIDEYPDDCEIPNARA